MINYIEVIIKVIKFVHIIIFLSILCSFLSATIINVPGQYPTIQAGINASTDGDTILVQPGTYYENINYSGKNVAVGSLFLTTEDSIYIELTIINGSQSGSVVTFENGESPSALICGFIITNGSGNIMPNGVYSGGGIFCHKDSDPTIKNNIITQNNAGDGGGLFCYIHSDPTIINVEISYNTAYDDGGGIHCNFGSCPIITNSKIMYNMCYDKGAGICCGHNEHLSNLTLNYVVICSNTSYEKGGAIYVANSISYLNNVTISENYSTYSGIYCTNSIINIINGILWNNYPQEIYLYNGGYLNATYSDIQNSWVGVGNINEDPLFVNPYNGDYHLQEDSPCIDAGDPNSPQDPDGTIADMGAYYFHQEGFINADFSGYPLSGIIPLEVQFTDLSIGNSIGWMWDFENDGIVDSNEQNPLYLYEQVGNYSVALTVTDGFIEDTEIKLNYITVIDTTNLNNNIYSFHTKLNQNYPNPFNPETTLSFSLFEKGYVSLEIFNIKGEKIRTLINEELLSGEYKIVWNGKDNLNQPVPSGVYLYQLKIGNKIYAKKMLLLK
ncbi:MAG: T9SS type A sorting domain-containing protein [Candidatus Cloacimonetes bacterium]|nr:T9SS type A sorting domain-containing protein [Candidatus Cloacimonadota bacterium]